MICPVVSRAARSGSGALRSNARVSGAARLSNAVNAAGKYSRSADRIRCRCRVRSGDQALVGPGKQFQGFDLRGIPCDLAVMAAVQPDDLGENVSVAGVGFGSRGAVPFPISCRRHRVDRIHLIATGQQRRHPHPTIGFDPDHDRTLGEVTAAGAVRIEMFGHHLVQSGQPLDALGQPYPRQPAAGVVFDLDVVMAFRPVIADEQHGVTLRTGCYPLFFGPVAEESRRRPNGSSTHRPARHRGTSSHQRSPLPSRPAGTRSEFKHQPDCSGTGPRLVLRVLSHRSPPTPNLATVVGVGSSH